MKSSFVDENEMHDSNDNFVFPFDLEELQIDTDDDKSKEDIFQFSNKTETSNAYEYLSSELNQMYRDLLALNLTHKQTNQVIASNIRLVQATKDAILALIEDDNGYNASQAVDAIVNFVVNRARQNDSQSKRSKKFEKDAAYIAPTEIAIGTRFKMKKTNDIDIKIPQRIQSTFQYVSILKTIQHLLDCDEFYDMYMKYNNFTKHKCEPDVYKSFCCGDVFKRNALFKKYPNSLQILIACDDFELCNALQSKAGNHKQCAFYFCIKNIPAELQSKLQNIFLLALCNSSYIKSAEYNYNEIWYVIENEIKELEANGLKTKEGALRGTLTRLAFDNLGANSALGFSGGFNAEFYCRICTGTKSENQVATKVNTAKIRTIANYEQQFDKISSSSKVKLKETEGIKQYRFLSNLEYFHIIENPVVDPMHDTCEGVLRVFMSCLFEYCEDKDIFVMSDVSAAAQFYNYGYLNTRNIPSRITDRANLNQNAAQCKCLFQNLPFILIEYENHPKLKKIWYILEALLRILETIYSPTILEIDLKRLEDDTEAFLKGCQDIFKIFNIPKFHFLLHYPYVIRQMGSVREGDMSRFDAKHRDFKKYRQATNNFISIEKSLAIKHQQMLLLNPFITQSAIRSGKKIPIKNGDISKIEIFEQIDDIIYSVNWLAYNEYCYRKNFVILKDQKLFEIENILFYKTKFLFVCKEMHAQGIDTFSNSLKIKTNENSVNACIEFENLENKKSYEVKILQDGKFIILATLELRHLFEK